MKTMKPSLKLAAVLLMFGVYSGCEDSGSYDVHGSVSYGVGFYDPWYYGSSHYTSAVIVVPPRSGNSIPVARPLPSRP
jgi:hypothetical protein